MDNRTDLKATVVSPPSIVCIPSGDLEVYVLALVTLPNDTGHDPIQAVWIGDSDTGVKSIPEIGTEVKVRYYKDFYRALDSGRRPQDRFCLQS